MASASPWVSFCISTYKRPEILSKQLLLLSRQTFIDFEVVVSDNDPDKSAKSIVEGMDDVRFRYFHNQENLGMIRSFNKSIERSASGFIVMITDDDPVENNFLATFNELEKKYPSYSVYGGFKRNGKKELLIELISKDDFITEILDPSKTSDILWSSSVVRKSVALEIGMIPDYGSPHLSDHAFTALAGSVNGGVIMNKTFSTLSSHDSNFSKFNFEYYVKGCEGFYHYMLSFLQKQKKVNEYKGTVTKHLGKWFITAMFTLKKYYTIAKKQAVVKDVDNCASEILKFPFMKKFMLRYIIKNAIFFIKKRTGLLR
jgi:glycosyltransferase involved in cell wall biosynthesis